MYLTERLAGVGLYAIVIVVFYALLGRADRKNAGKILFLCSLALTLMAYFYVPSKTADIARLTDMAENWKDTKFIPFIRYAIHNSKTPLGTIYLYLNQKYLGKGAISASAAFITYNCSFFVLSDYARRNNSSSADIAFSFFTLMSAGIFIEVISGVRSLMALTISAVAVYRYHFCRRNYLIDILLYVVAALIHPAALAIIALHIMSVILDFSMLSVNRIIAFAAAVVVLILFRNQIFPYVSYGVSKFMRYLTRRYYSYKWEYLIRTVSLIMMTYILYVYGRNQAIQKEEIRGYLSFLILMTAAELVTISEFSTCNRLVSVQITMIQPVLLAILDDPDSGNRFRWLIVLLSLVCLFIACARGNLSGYKFFVL